VLVSAAAFQLAVLIGMVLVVSRPLRAAGGRTVLLHVVPVDPRDLLRGDYVILSYDASQAWPPNATREEALGKTVYVTIAPGTDDRHYRATRGDLTPPPAGSLFLRGTSTPSGIQFGIESYFVQEGRGRVYEEAARRGNLWAEVAVAPDGAAALRRLVVE
jgi:uncharacterized membrane-anchored protein